WLKRHSWTLEEATALSLGKDPSEVDARSLASQILSPKESPFFRSYLRRYGLLQSAVAVGDATDPLRPEWYMKWASAKGLSCPPQLTFVEANVDDGLTAPIGKHRTTDSTFYKLILGMAICHYEFDPKYDRTTETKAFSRIVNDLKRAGIETNVQTVQNALVTAALWAKNKEVAVRAPRTTWIDEERRHSR